MKEENFFLAKHNLCIMFKVNTLLDFAEKKYQMYKISKAFKNLKKEACFCFT